MARDRYVDSDDYNDVTLAVQPRRIEVLSGRERRRKWSDEAKIAIGAEALAPGAVVSEVARRHDVVPSQLFGWMRQFREAATAEVMGFSSLYVKATYTENGKVVAAHATFSSTDGQSQTTTGAPVAQWHFVPKALGKTTVTSTVNGISKSIDINVVPYVKVDPTVAGDDLNTVIPTGSEVTGVAIGTLILIPGDEPIQIEQIAATSNVNAINVRYDTYKIPALP
jgi:transposase-like protein